MNDPLKTRVVIKSRPVDGDFEAEFVISPEDLPPLTLLAEASRVLGSIRAMIPRGVDSEFCTASYLVEQAHINLQKGTQ